MTAGSLTLDKALSPSRPRLRTVGEFLITGGATLALIPFAYWYRKEAGLDDSEYFVSFLAFYAAYLINDPHFSVSYLLFYKNIRGRLNGAEFRGMQRLRYLIAGFVVPLALSIWIAAALIMQSSWILGTMIQLMFLLVGWHYVKQGFGVLMVLSARRNISFTPQERFYLLAHCFAAWAYSWATPWERGEIYEESGVVYQAFAQPAGLKEVTLVCLVISIIGLGYVTALRITKRQPFPPLAGVCGFLMSIWLWTIFSSFDPLIAYVIPGLHSLQYWYFVYLMKRNEAEEEGRTEQITTSFSSRLATVFGAVHGRLLTFFLTAVALSWFFFNGLPHFLDGTIVATIKTMGDDPNVSTLGLGATPFLAAFATFINIHHYFIDNVLWRRENPDTRFLKGPI